jgi:hypothetical protein
MRLGRRAIFAGSNVHHNRVAAAHILSSIAPRFEKEIEFVLLGPCTRRFLRHQAPNVTIDPDGELAEYGCPGALGLNPVVAGSGSSLKLLYYLAHDLPTLSTPFGLRGHEGFAPWVTTAELEHFPDALECGSPSPDGVRERLAPYEWDAAAERALEAYEAVTGSVGRRRS